MPTQLNDFTVLGTLKAGKDRQLIVRQGSIEEQDLVDIRYYTPSLKKWSRGMTIDADLVEDIINLLDKAS